MARPPSEGPTLTINQPWSAAGDRAPRRQAGVIPSGAKDISRRWTAVRPGQCLASEGGGHGGQRLRTETIRSDPNDLIPEGLDPMDLVESIDSVERSESENDRFAFVLRHLPPRMLAETKLRHHHVRMGEEGLHFLERIQFDAADQLA
jgi:hypothetical protein